MHRPQTQACLQIGKNLAAVQPQPPLSAAEWDHISHQLSGALRSFQVECADANVVLSWPQDQCFGVLRLQEYSGAFRKSAQTVQH